MKKKERNVEGLREDLRSLARLVAFHKNAQRDTILRASRVKFELRELQDSL